MLESDFAIREAREVEIPALRAIEDKAALIFAHLGMPLLLEMEPTAEETWRRTIAAGTAWVVADQENRAVAFALCLDTADALHLQELDVDPSVARRRIGAALIDFVAARARELGHQRVTLTTYRDVPWNAPYYDRLGFTVLDRDQQSERLRECRRAEAEMGLDFKPRVAMELRLEPE